MARKTRLLSFLAAALVALTTVVAAGTRPQPFWSPDLSVSIKITAKAGAGITTSWQAP